MPVGMSIFLTGTEGSTLLLLSGRKRRPNCPSGPGERQVPTQEKGDKQVYGYIGKLTQLHPEMVLAIPYFSTQSPETPSCIAYLPFAMIKPHSRGYLCEPATFNGGIARPRRDFLRFFGTSGLMLVEWLSWKTNAVDKIKSDNALELF